jgi:hypothetical protein
MLSSRLFAARVCGSLAWASDKAVRTRLPILETFLGGYWFLTSSTASCTMPSQHSLFTLTSGCALSFPVWIPGCVAQIYHGAVSLVASGDPIMKLLR